MKLDISFSCSGIGSGINRDLDIHVEDGNSGKSSRVPLFLVIRECWVEGIGEFPNDWDRPFISG
jgi:hypothetical protein